MTFALYRGGEWVALPDRPDLELSPDPSRAWASESLALAIERAGVPACLPEIGTVAVRRLP